MKRLLIFLLFVNQACTKELEAPLPPDSRPLSASDISQRLKDNILYNIKTGGLYGIPPKYKDLYVFYVDLNNAPGKLLEISFSSATDFSVKTEIKNAFRENPIDWSKYDLSDKEKVQLRFPVVFKVHQASDSYIPFTESDAEKLLVNLDPSINEKGSRKLIVFSPIVDNLTTFK